MSLLVAAVVSVQLMASDVAERPTPGPGDLRLAMFTREHVHLELWSPLGAREARVVLRNRNDTRVLVCYEVDEELGKPVAYEVDLLAEETRGGDGRYVVPTGGVAAPRVVITSVDDLPISEDSGYVLLDEESSGRISIRLYRPENGGKRAFAVLTNADDRPLTVQWEASGLIEGQIFKFTTDLAVHAVKGLDGSVQLPYKPAFDPRYRTRPRIKIISVTR